MHEETSESSESFEDNVDLFKPYFFCYSTDAEKIQLWFTLIILTEPIRNSESRFFGSLMTIMQFTCIASYWPVIDPR